MSPPKEYFTVAGKGRDDQNASMQAATTSKNAAP
jgi:hypothetical protein